MMESGGTGVFDFTGTSNILKLDLHSSINQVRREEEEIRFA